MKANRFREAIAEGRVPIGHMVWEFATRGMAKILDSADLDFVLIDMEHSGFDVDKVYDLIAWSKAAKFAPIVRVPSIEYQFMARIMDSGALGIMAPNVQTAEEAKLIVDSVKYAPFGKRGVGLNTAHTDFTMPKLPDFFEESNRNSVVVCLIESPLGVKNAEAIAKVPGVDVLWVGHFDLTQAMGIPGQFNNSDFITHLQHVADVAKAHNLRAGIQVANPDQIKKWSAMGYNVLSTGADSTTYRAALDAGVKNLREFLGQS